jgi:hypothetical protein
MRRISLFMLLISLPIPLKAGTLYFAEVIDGGGYVTTFTIVNPTTNTATGTLKLRKDDGSPWVISFLNHTLSSQFSISVPPMGTLRLISSGAGSSVTVGWAVLDSQANLQAVERFDYRPDTVLEDSVSLNGTSSAKRFILPVDTFGTWDTGFDTGFAIANVGTTNANIELTLLDEDGNTFVSTVYPPLTPLAANRQIAVFVTEVFPVLQSGLFRGLLEIEVSEGAGDIAVVGLSFKERQFSTIPVVPLEASSPTQMTSQERLNLILGRWVFTYTTTKQITHTYTINATLEDTSDPGEYYAAGWNENSDLVVVVWSEDLEAYGLLDLGTSMGEFYVFSLIGANSVSGCMFVIDSSTGDLISDCYPMTGNRTASFSSLRASDLGHESQPAEEMKAMCESRSLCGSNSIPDPAILKELERLKSIRTSH